MSKKHRWADVIHAFAEGKEIQWRFVNYDWENLSGDNPQFNNTQIEWRVKPHKYQDVIDAYLRGETVQCFKGSGYNKRGWVDVVKGTSLDVFDTGHQYRIKPKPDIRARLWSHNPIDKFHLVFVFDGETKAFKTVEYHDE